MMLTMCPSWALADDDGIAPLPLVDENRPVAESAPVEADPTETPAVPTPSEPEAKPAEDQNTASAPSGDEANGGTDSTESGNNNASSDASEDNSQNNSAADSTPDVNNQPQDAADINDVSMASLDAVPYSWNDVQTIDAEMWITNARATDANGVNTLTIRSDMGGITEDAGIPVTELAPEIRNNIIGYETTVFWQARVLSGNKQTTNLDDDKTASGTEIDAIRYYGNNWKRLQYRDKANGSWRSFAYNDQLVFYYLVRTDYSKMVQIDVSDWALNYEPTDMTDRRSVTYRVYVKGGNEDGTDKLAAIRTFWYNKTFTVSSVLVREADADHYTIEDVKLDPDALGKPTKNENGEYQFSLNLSETNDRNATVKIYVTPKNNVQPHELIYVLNDGQITSEAGTYSLGSVYPEEPIILPTVVKDNCIFEGWYTDEACTEKWNGGTMPNENLTLYAKFTAKETPKPEPEPEPELTPAKYFVLLPNRGKPDDNHDQGEEFYLPSSKSNGGVDGLDQSTGYIGSLTQEGADAVPKEGNSVTDIVNGVSPKYLNVPSDLGFFDAKNWTGNTYNDSSANTSILGKNFNVKSIRIVWYTIKNQGMKDGELDIHVDGYIKNVAINVTYHSNFVKDQTHNDGTKTGTNYRALSYDKTTLPTRDGYVFGGWYTDAACNTPYEPKVLMTSLDLYAKWVKNVFDVSYFVDGSVYKIDDKEQISSHVNGEEVTLLDKPTKTGYTFSGWTPAADVANIIKVADGKFTMPAQNVLFNGTFTINQYNVTYKVGTEVVYTDVYNFNSDVAIRPVPTKDGYTFTGWKIGDKDAENFKMPAHNVEIHGSYRQNTRKYTVNKHFYDEKGAEIAELASTANASGAENAPIADLYKADAKNQTVDGKNYVYVPGLTKVTDNLEKLTKDVTIDLHYYLNVEGGNDTPDAWEYRLTFKVVNGEWNDGGNADLVAYVPFKDYKTGKDLEYVVVPATRIPPVGEKPNSGYHAGSWDTTPVGNDKVQKDTVFTYTYAKNSSGGSSGSSGGSSGSSGGGYRRPTVTIPDEVPTGLNGNDHYAYIVGYPDKTVRPQNGITRAKVATIFFRLLTDETRNANSTKSNSYSDVAAGAWYNHAVSTLSAMGIVKGDSNGKFNPNASITRAEFAAIAARFDDKANTSAASFSDIANHWAKDEISAAANNGWITGYTDGTFRPNNRITRAEAMALVNRVLKRLPETDEDLHADMIKWSDNSDASQWYYLDVLEATNSHYYQTKENQFEKWTELRDTRDWTELEK